MEVLSQTVFAQLATIFEHAAGTDESGASRSFILAPFSRRNESGCEESRMRKTGSQTETLRGLSVCDRAVGKRLRLFVTWGVAGGGGGACLGITKGVFLTCVSITTQVLFNCN